MNQERIGVLLMGYGSPENLAQVESYLADIRGGRPSSPEAVAELRERYRRVGVPTPLLAVSRELARRVEAELNRSTRGAAFMVRVGMKHWSPRIPEAIGELVSGGAERLVAIALAPHYSRISIGGYRSQVERARQDLAPGLALDLVESWHDLAGYLETLAASVRRELDRMVDPGEAVVIFTAHSLPARILAEGDPYRDQLLTTSEQIARRAGVDRWEFSFQSQSQTGEPWLGPDLLETMDRLARAGIRQVLVAPAGFIADHLEILFDIDIEARERAERLGIELRRIPMLNADPRLAAALAGLVRRRAGLLQAVEK